MQQEASEPTDSEQEVVNTDTQESLSEPTIEEIATKKTEDGYIDFNTLSDDIRPTVEARIKADSRIKTELKRKAEEAERQRLELEKKLLEATKPKEAQAPTADDFYRSPEDAAKMQEAFVQNSVAQKEYEFKREQLAQQEQQAQIEKAQATRQQLFDRAKSAGIDSGELDMATNIVAQQLSTNTELQWFIAEHELAPQLIVHLARNPMDLQTLATTSTFAVGEKLNEMARPFKPTRKSSVPPPDDPITGSGVDANKDPWLQGATIE